MRVVTPHCATMFANSSELNGIVDGWTMQEPFFIEPMIPKDEVRLIPIASKE